MWLWLIWEARPEIMYEIVEQHLLGDMDKVVKFQQLGPVFCKDRSVEGEIRGRTR